jgi:Uma2 family endonuclease
MREVSVGVSVLEFLEGGKMFQLREEYPLRHGEAMNPDEFEQLIERMPDIRYEYMHGRAYAMSGGTANYSRLTGKMFRLLEEQLTSGPCHAFFDMYVVLAEDSRALPDVVVTCDVSDYRGNATLIRSPHLIVEVLSTSTERIDRNEKFIAYTQLPSVEEYVLVHQYRSQVEVYRRIDGWTLHMYGPGEEIELASLDIYISLDELYTALL